MTTQGNTFMNAVVGALVTLVLSLVPLAPVVGGGVSGYLQRGSQTEGAKVGGLAGLIATFPLFLVLVVVVPFFVIAPLGVAMVPGSPFAFVIGLFFITAVYAIVPGLIGGVVGVYLANARAED